MGQMASELAHELNQPLATILTQSDIALRKIRAKEMDNDAVGKIIEDIGKQAELAGKIIKRVRDFSQKKEPKHKRTNINDIVKEAMKFVEMEARACNVVPEFDLSENIPSIVADPIQIEQVIINLVLNSLEAMGNTDVKRRKLALQTLVTPKKDVEIRVHDTGSGMSPEIIKKMFEPFFTTKSQGLGIGLSISRSIIEAHGGRLWAECESDNAGATFKFTLPSA
jgi:C4-dicarboxylate-specific signal transduction histidine kinase